MPTPLTTIVAAFDTDRDAGRPLLGIVQGVSPEAAALPGQEDVGPARSSRIVEPAASADHRHQERMVGRLEIADHPHTVEAAVQKQQAAANPDLGGLMQKVLQDRLQGFAPGDRGQCHGEAVTVADDVERGVGVEVAGPALGLGAVDLVGIMLRLAMIGDQDQIGGHALRAATQGPGQVVGQGGVEPCCNSAKSGKVAMRAKRTASSEGASRRALQASESEVIRAAA